MLKNILNPVAKPYVKRSLKKRGNPFEIFKEKKAGIQLPPADKGVVFLGPIRMSAEAHLFEGIIGYAYRLKGYKVYAVMCGQKLDDCETLPLDKSFRHIKCTTCYSQQKLFCEAFDIEPLYLKDYISTEEDAKIKQTRLELDQMMYDGVDIESHVSSGVMRVLKKSTLDKNDLELINRFGKSTMLTMTAARNMMKKFQPAHLIMSHGTYSTWGGLILAAEQENVHRVVWGRGYVGKGNIMATHDGSYLYKNTEEPKSNYDDVVLTEELEKKVHDYFKGKRNPATKVDYVSYYSTNSKTDQDTDIREKLNIPKDKVIIGMFPNIPWDGQAFSYSELFPSIREFIVSAVDWCRNSEAVLVIRAHPAEIHSRSSGQLETFQNILEELYPTLPENVLFLPPESEITSYELEAEISAALLYAGTIGLEFSMNGTAVIQAGKNSFFGKGFIFEPQSMDDFLDLLGRAEKNELKLSPEMHKNCERYGYHWIFRRHFPETIIAFEGAQQFKGYNFAKADEILQNDELSQFIACIEERKDFIYKPG